MSEDKNKRIIGLYGEMCLAMELHQKGWQVYRAYIDEQIDFIIARYYCKACKNFSQLETRGKKAFLTNLCGVCKQDTLEIIVRFIQVKASEGELKNPKKPDVRSYSFHAKLRSNVDDRAFYAWIALTPGREKDIPHFYIFGHKEISRFDDVNLPSYQKTDNQKTTLRINEEGEVVTKGRKYDYSCFNNDFYNNFDKLEMRDALKKRIIK